MVGFKYVRVLNIPGLSILPGSKVTQGLPIFVGRVLNMHWDAIVELC